MTYLRAVVLSEEVVASLWRPASVAAVGGFRTPEDPLTSWLGRVRVLGQSETWPSYDGAPMVGICQILLAELPFVPPALSDVALFSLFMRDEAGHPALPGGAEDEGWEIRTYADLGDLTAVDGHVAAAIRPFPVRWAGVADDLPTWEDALRVLGEEQLGAIDDHFDELISGPADGFKVGGWPSLIQSEIYWAPWNRHPAEPDYVLQIDSDAKTGLAWGDAGVLYIGRGVFDSSTWALEWQCM